MNAPDYDLAALVPPGLYAVDARRLLEQAQGVISSALATERGESKGTAPANRQALDRALRRTAADAGVDSSALFMLLRVALVGRLSSPGLFDAIALLGPAETLSRIGIALQRLNDTSL